MSGKQKRGSANPIPGRSSRTLARSVSAASTFRPEPRLSEGLGVASPSPAPSSIVVDEALARGQKRDLPDYANEPARGAGTAPAEPSATSARHSAIADEGTPSPEEEESAPGSEQGVGRDELAVMLQEATLRTRDEVLGALAESEARHQDQLEQSEARHQDQLELLRRQHQEMIRMLQERATDRGQRPEEQAPARMPLPTARSSTPPPRHGRHSLASHIAFGADATPAHLARDPPPHIRFGTATSYPPMGDRHRSDPQRHPDPAATPIHQPQVHAAPPGWEERAPRRFERAKPQDLGYFDPLAGDDVCSWWRGLVAYMEYSASTEAEIFAGISGCFLNNSKQWFNNLSPRPRTLRELRRQVFEAFIRDETLIAHEVNQRRFEPAKESLDVYLTDMFRLVSELHTARAVNRGGIDAEPISLDATMTTITVRDAIETAHQGLPPEWAILLDQAKEAATDWANYRMRVMGKEQRTRITLQLLRGRGAATQPTRRQPDQSSGSSPQADRHQDASRPKATHRAGQRPETAEEDRVRRLDRELGRCFICHSPAHAKRDCPERGEATRMVRLVLHQLEHDEDDEDTWLQVRRIMPSFTRSESTSDDRPDHRHDGESDISDEDDVRRIRQIRAHSSASSLASLSTAAGGHIRTVRSIQRADEPGRRSSRISPQDQTVPGRLHREVVAHKAAVCVGKDPARLELHVDGGSPLSMITPKALRSVAPDAPVLAGDRLKIKGYRGDDLQHTQGVVVLDVTFPTSNQTDPVRCQFEFHVVQECTGGWILGVDNMKAEGIDALSKRERLAFERRPDAFVRLLQKGDRLLAAGDVGRIVCARRLRVAAHTTRLVEIDPVATDRVVRPWWFTHEQEPSGFLKVPSCIVGPRTRAIEVANTSDSDIELQEGDALGDTEALEEEIGSLEELRAELTPPPKGRRRFRNGEVADLYRAWQRRGGPTPRTVRRLLLTHAEPHGDDVLPEIDVPRPDDRSQTVSCSSRLSSDQRARLKRVLQAHAVWPTPRRPLGTYEYGRMALRLKAGQEQWVHAEPPRRTSPAQREVIDDTIAEHDEMGISEPSRGAYASGVVLVQQKGKIRFCNDYRPLNKVTQDDVYVMPTVDVIYDRLGKARIFSVLDANKGYYQFLLDDDSCDLTGFITFRGLRRYRRMPFGLKQAPSWFQRAMDRILGDARWKFALAYLDDIVVYSASFSDHLVHLDTVLAALERAGLTVSPSKCKFAFESASLLGYKVNSVGLMTDGEKTKAVTQFPEPTSANEARRFFAMAAWYRRFIKDFAARARPVNRSFVGETFTWGPPERAAFEDLRRAVATAPVLLRPDFSRPFVLAVDASKVGLGGVLLQQDDQGRERPVLFVSRQTTEGERKYAPTHLELAAVWWCVKKLHHYIDGSEVEVRTDHNALRWLWDLKPAQMSEPRVQKYKMALAPLEGKVKISYTKGKDNVVADALSRAPLPATEPGEEESELRFIAREYRAPEDDRLSEEAEHAVRSISVLRMGSDELASWASAYASDPHWRRIWKRSQDRSVGDVAAAVDRQDGPSSLVVEPGTAIESSALSNSSQESDDDGAVEETLGAPEPALTAADEQEKGGRRLRPRRVLAVHLGTDDSLFFAKDGLLFVRQDDGVRLCVPAAKLSTLIHEYHTSIRSGHPSLERTVGAMKDHIFARDLAQRVAAHVRTCYECQVNKAPRHRPYGDLQPIASPNEVFHTIGMDFVTGLPKTTDGFDSIIVVADKYSRFAFFVANRVSDTAEDVALRFLERIFPVTGLPTAIISDRDPRFTSAFWTRFLHELDIKPNMSTAFHPQTDGLVERLNAQLETMLRHYIAIDQHDWDRKLPALSMAYNAQRQDSTEQSPYLLVFGREPNIFPLRAVAEAADPARPRTVDLFAIHADAQAAMDLARERQRRQYNKKHQPLNLAVGDAVLINLKNYRFNLDPTDTARVKLGPRMAGPFRVKARVGRLAYELEVPPWFKAHPVLPISALEPFRGDPDAVAPRPQAGIAADGGHDEIRVLGFLGRRPTVLDGGDMFDYLIRWAGPLPTWQSDNNLPGLAWARKDFERRARSELGLTRLRRSRTIILPEAADRARDLEALALDTAKRTRTSGSPLGGEIVTGSPPASPTS